MCTLLIAYRCLDDAPVVVVANRDEFFDRASTEPRVLNDAPLIVGGADVETGGTWLAVAADGRVAAVTNRWCDGIDPSRLSRGELPAATLLAGDAGARRWVSGRDPTRYNPFNLIYLSHRQAFVGHCDGTGPMRMVDLDPGLHVVTLGDVDQEDDAKVSFLTARLRAAARPGGSAAAARAAMEQLLCEHGDDLDAACVHGDGYGTVSSSSVVLASSGEVSYRYAPGPPCRTAHRDVSRLLHQDLDERSPTR